MKNENIFYIDYLNSYLDVNKSNFPKWIKYIIYKIYRIFGIIRKKENILILPVIEDSSINKIIYKKLKRKLEVERVKNVVISDYLAKRCKLELRLKHQCNVLDGRWLYKFLIFEIIKKISLVQNKKIGSYEITILCNKKQDVDIENIKLLANKCKIVNVITKDIKDWYEIERGLQEKGIVLNVSTNLEKTARYSDIVINCDFEKEFINKCNLKKSSILIQCGKDIIEKNNIKVIMNLKLSIDKKYEKIFSKLNHFDSDIIYESLIYYRNSFKSMQELLKRDKVNIKYFEGANGKMNFRELKICK